MEHKTRDFLAGASFLIIGLLIAFVLIPLGVVEPKKVKFAALSPSYYPRIVAGCMILIGLAVIILSRFTSLVAENTGSLHPNAFARFLMVITLLAGFAMFLETIGFVPMSAIALVVLMWLGGERRWHVLLPVALVAPFALHYFFLYVAHIPIPSGLLAEHLPGF